MAERRSLGAALTISPEKLAFIQGGSTAPAARTPSESAGITATEVNHGEVASRLEVAADGNLSQAPAKTVIRTTGKQTTARPIPNATRLPAPLWVPITTRLQQRTATALRRAHLEQRLRSAMPDTQQEIFDLAVQQWLQQNGYWK